MPYLIRKKTGAHRNYGISVPDLGLVQMIPEGILFEEIPQGADIDPWLECEFVDVAPIDVLDVLEAYQAQEQEKARKLEAARIKAERVLVARKEVALGGVALAKRIEGAEASARVRAKARAIKDGNDPANYQKYISDEERAYLDAMRKEYEELKALSPALADGKADAMPTPPPKRREDPTELPPSPVPDADLFYDPDADDETSESLSALSRPELQDRAYRLGHRNLTRFRKQELVELILSGPPDLTAEE